MQGLTTIPVILTIAAGGALGSVMRYGAAQLMTPDTGTGFPAAIMVINIVGSFLMGVMVVILLAKFPQHGLLRMFLTIGVLGGFTTFSTFAFDVVALFERGDYGMAAAYTGGSVIFSIAALFAGLGLGRALS